MRIIVTGGSSAIGTRLLAKLTSLESNVIDLSDKSRYSWRLGHNLPKFESDDLLIHLAHDRNSSFNDNIKAVNKICGSFSGKKVFLSSISAHSRSRSKYGKSKFEQEKIFLNHGGIVLRAGVVFGGRPAGIYLTLEKLLQRFKIIPVPYSGMSTFFMSHVDDLINELVSYRTLNISKPIFCANPTPLSTLKLMKRISLLQSSSNVFVSLPVQPADIFIRASAKLFPSIKEIDSLLSISIEVSNYEISQLNKPLNNFRSFL